MANYESSTSGSLGAVNPTHYVDWGAIFAGVFVSLAISTVFLAFGSALGLSATSLQWGSTMPGKGMIIAGALWLLWVQVSSFLGGGYVTGRMRRTIGDAAAHEVEIRDGMHGLIVWGVNITIGAALASWLILAAGSGTVNVASKSDALAYSVDRLVRSDTVQPGVNSDQVSNAKAEMARVLAKSIGVQAPDEADKNYLVHQISARTGLPQADAQKRLDDEIQAIKAKAETARRYAILLAFLTAASFLVSGVAAWWSAMTGGKHRNEGVDHSRFTKWS
jgi:hypothetical protein